MVNVIRSKTERQVDTLVPSLAFGSGRKGQSPVFLCFFFTLPSDFNHNNDLQLEQLWLCMSLPEWNDVGAEQHDTIH